MSRTERASRRAPSSESERNAHVPEGRELGSVATRSIKLLDDAVLVRLEKPERLTASKLLIIPDSAKREAYELYQATVLQTGPGAFRKHDGKRNPCEVKKGDRVLCYWTAVEMDVTSFFPKGEEHRIISEKSIQAVLD